MIDWKEALHASTSVPIMRVEAQRGAGGEWRVVVKAGSEDGWLICDFYTSRPNVNQPKAITADDAIAECMYGLTRKIKDWRNKRAEQHYEAS